MSHVRVWKFRPPADREDAFVEAYASDGAWAQLFAQAAGFLGTTLLRPVESNGWWLTIDRWQSFGDFERFDREFGDAYRALDEELEGIAGEEDFVGTFEDAG